jgi:DNA (cytosine-5)-methyltransferase 1
MAIPLTAKSYFSGAGGMDLGLSEAGINIIQSIILSLFFSILCL